MAHPVYWFTQEHFHEKPRNVFLQIDVTFLSSDLLERYLSRRDYKDNHDVFITHMQPILSTSMVAPGGVALPPVPSAHVGGRGPPASFADWRWRGHS
jgi:hypothetical protein